MGRERLPYGNTSNAAVGKERKEVVVGEGGIKRFCCFR